MDEQRNSYSDQVPDWIKKASCKLCKISFAGKIVKQILDPELINIYDSKLSSIMGSSRNGVGFPGSLAISILREDFDVIRTHEYKILLKSDGTRYGMFIFTYEDGDGRQLNVVDLMDRSYTHYVVTSAFAKTIYQGTLFDGELVKTKEGKYEYQIFDCMAYCGKYVGKEPHHKRLEIARNCIEKLYKFDEATHTFSVVVKQYLKPEEALSSLFDNNHFPVDGWILQDTNREYISGKDTALFKYKTSGNHTIDLKVWNMEGVTSLCVIDNGRMLPVQSPTNITKESMDKLSVSNERMLNGQILECYWSENKRLWIPLCKRSDKDVPNNLFTYNQTVRNIEQNITAREIFNLLSK